MQTLVDEYVALVAKVVLAFRAPVPSEDTNSITSARWSRMSWLNAKWRSASLTRRGRFLFGRRLIAEILHLIPSIRVKPTST